MNIVCYMYVNVWTLVHMEAKCICQVSQSLPYSLETGSLIQTGARLTSIKP